MHHLVRASDIELTPAYEQRSSGYSRCSLVDGSTGSVHMGLGLAALEGPGAVDLHVHSYEESFFVTTGNPVLVLDRRAITLMPGACGVVPVGVPHAWRGGGQPARWIDMAAPQPRGARLARPTRSGSAPHRTQSPRRWTFATRAPGTCSA